MPSKTEQEVQEQQELKRKILEMQGQEGPARPVELASNVLSPSLFDLRCDVQVRQFIDDTDPTTTYSVVQHER